MLDFRKSLINGTLNKVLKRLHYPLEVMLTCVRWYVAYPLSLRHIEEMMQDRGVFVDHSTVHRWATKMLPVLAAVFRKRKRPVGSSWRMDETYIKVAGHWKYLYRAVDRALDGHLKFPHLCPPKFPQGGVPEILVLGPLDCICSDLLN
jgi:transposase-like protein